MKPTVRAVLRHISHTRPDRRSLCNSQYTCRPTEASVPQPKNDVETVHFPGRGDFHAERMSATTERLVRLRVAGNIPNVVERPQAATSTAMLFVLNDENKEEFRQF